MSSSVQTLKIGLTGGIGSGKTLVSQFFTHRGVPVYNSDINAKLLMVNNCELKHEIITCFGAESYTEAGELNRPYLSKLIFNNKENQQKINDLVHPAVNKHFLQWVEKQNTTFVLFESALLFQSITRKDLDYIFSVSAPLETRIERVCERDNSSKEQVLARIKSQVDQSEIDKRADEVILNDKHSLLIPQLLTILEKYSNGKV